MGKSWSDETVAVGHKLKQLIRSCGHTLSEDALNLLFSSLGGTGSSVDFSTFMSVMVCFLSHPPHTHDLASPWAS